MSQTPRIHLNLNVRGMPNSATVAINERSNALKAEGREVFKLGLGQSRRKGSTTRRAPAETTWALE